MILVLTLTVQFVFAAEISDESSTILKVNGIIKCDRSTEYYGTRWIDGRGADMQYIPTTGENGNCFTPDPENSFDTTCCPQERNLCKSSGTSTSEGREKGTCNISISKSCLDLKTESECNTATPSLAEYYYNKIIHTDGGEYCYTRSSLWIESGKYAWNETSCSCKWNGSSCIGALNYLKKFGDGISFSNYGRCDNPIISVTDTCDSDGYIIYEIGAEWVKIVGDPEKPDDCVPPEPSRVACGSVAKLDFFSIFNVISVIISLMIIYSFYQIKDRKKYR